MKNKKKILFISPLPPPNYGSAISSKMCLNILKSSKSFEIKNVKLNASKKISDVGKINFSKFFGFFKLRKLIIKYLKQFNPDLIYFMPATSGKGFLRDFYVFKILNKFYPKERILFHIRTRIPSNNWKKNFYRKRYNFMFKNQKIIILDKSFKKDFKNLVPEQNFFILPNAIKNELSEMQIKKIIKKRSKEKLKILFLSNMIESKGWLKVLKSCAILRKMGVDFECNFVGAWPSNKERRKFYHFVRKNSLEKTAHYLGRKVGDKKNKVLENSNVLVFPTSYSLETFGRVIIEAMMYALPVIANGIASIPTTIKHNKTGFLLKKNSPKEIVEYLIKLNNEKLRNKMGLKGRKRFLKEYEFGKYEKRFLRLFNPSFDPPN